MDFLSTTGEQLKEMFREMTPGSRMIAGLLAVVIIASIGFLFQGGMFVPDASLRQRRLRRIPLPRQPNHGPQ